ncbi:MAG: PASTA domain-containing protein [Bacteroidales bacterium]|nr:PASTA domain-containing protein [Bacteroidales bacterium]
MNFLKFLISRVFFKNLLYATAGFFSLILLVFLILKIYTRHGQELSVPDFIGMTIDEVKELSNSKKLRYQIIDSVFIYERKKGTVIEQNPPPNSKVKANRTIFFTTNAFKQVKVFMPEIVGVSLRQAKAILETRGLKVGKLIYVTDFARNNVLEQKYKGKRIETSTKIEKGTSIDVVLGKGFGNQYTPVPNILNLTHKNAVSRITSSYLNVGVVNFDESVQSYKDTIYSQVWKQSPDYKWVGSVRLGSPINIWLTVKEDKFPVEDSVKTKMQ